MGHYQVYLFNAGFEVLTVVLMKIHVFWDMKLPPLGIKQSNQTASFPSFGF